jgi:hypothetical protein
MKLKHLICSILLLSITSSITAQVTPANKPLTEADVLAFKKSEPEYQQVQKELQQLEQQKKQLFAIMNAFNEQQKKVINRLEKLETSYDALGAKTTTTNPASPDNSQYPQVNATKQLQETQMSFNLQYLQLQSQMQRENMSFTAVSNIMKTKHDTVKNSISNIR